MLQSFQVRLSVMEAHVSSENKGVFQGQLLKNIYSKCINASIPEFLKWTLPFLNLDMSTDSNRGFSLKLKAESQTV